MKTIIIYATKHGCVGHAVNILKTKLEGPIKLVNIMEEKVPPLDDYDTVIIGGSIYVGKLQKKITQYIESHLSQLLMKKIGLFICGAEKREQEREQELRNAFPTELSEHALCIEILGYEIHYEDMNFLEKKITSHIIGHKKDYSELSVEKINEFAHQISAS